MDTCYSGGAAGADTLFGKKAEEAGHKVVHFSFEGHKNKCKNGTVSILGPALLESADRELRAANMFLGRTYPTTSNYVNNLLRRNYYIIQQSERVYAVTAFDIRFKAIGGTAWGIILSINNGIEEIYVYDQSRTQWFKFGGNEVMSRYTNWDEVDLEDIPVPYGKYAGIGSRELSSSGRRAIESLYDR